MTGDKMTAFDNNPPYINLGSGEVKKFIKGIKEKSKILEIIGDLN